MQFFCPVVKACDDSPALDMNPIPSLRENEMLTYKRLVFAAAIALIASLSAPSIAAPLYYKAGPSCVEDNGFGPYPGHC
jgi:hypothetical protein